MDVIIDLIKNYWSILLSFLAGFGTGAITLKIITNIKIQKVKGNNNNTAGRDIN